MNKITAKEGYVFRRKHDGMIFGKEVYLGYDYSTGEKIMATIDFFDEIEEPIEENLELI